jgi:hypothetical protein
MPTADQMFHVKGRRKGEKTFAFLTGKGTTRLRVHAPSGPRAWADEVVTTVIAAAKVKGFEVEAKAVPVSRRKAS